jgi:hypothetical protein
MSDSLLPGEKTHWGKSLVLCSQVTLRCLLEQLLEELLAFPGLPTWPNGIVPGLNHGKTRSLLGQKSLCEEGEVCSTREGKRKEGKVECHLSACLASVNSRERGTCQEIDFSG